MVSVARSTTFVSEPITPVGGSFDAAAMACGEPGLPRQFKWRNQEFTVMEVLEQGKDYGDCTHGSGERYLRKHTYRVRTSTGLTMQLYCLRTGGKGKLSQRSRWWMRSVSDSVSAPIAP